MILNKNLAVINAIMAVGDVAIAAIAILSFTYVSIYFGRWWITLFSILPILLYSSHSLIIDADIEQAKEGEQNA